MEYRWRDHIDVQVALEREKITSYLANFFFAYTYLFNLGFSPPIDLVIIDFYRYFNICLA